MASQANEARRRKQKGVQPVGEWRLSIWSCCRLTLQTSCVTVSVKPYARAPALRCGSRATSALGKAIVVVRPRKDFQWQQHSVSPTLDFFNGNQRPIGELWSLLMAGLGMALPSAWGKGIANVALPAGFSCDRVNDFCARVQRDKPKLCRRGLSRCIAQRASVQTRYDPISEGRDQRFIRALIFHIFKQ